MYSISPTEITKAGETITIKGSKLEDAYVTVGGVECDIRSSDDSEIKCKLADFVTGNYKLKLEGALGSPNFGDLGSIDVILAASKLDSTTYGTNGGASVTITGFGFSEDVIVEVIDANGQRLCEFCKKTSVTPSEIVFITPAAHDSGAAQVLVKHEWLETVIPPFDVMYVDSFGAIGDATMSELGGSESITFSNGEYDCSKHYQVDFIQRKDPCAVGQHECHHHAECIPTADGLDYTCNCLTWEDDTYTDRAGLGDGRSCFKYEIQNPESFDDINDDFCVGKSSSYTHFDANTPYLKQMFKDFIATGVTTTRGLMLKVDGVWTCAFRELDSEGNGVGAQFVGTTAAECDAFNSKDTYYVMCQRGPEPKKRGCVDKNNHKGYGYYDYMGFKSTTAAGLECDDWDNLTEDDWDGDDKIANRRWKELKLSGNTCLPINSGKGPVCYPKLTDRDGDRHQQPCGVPFCSEYGNVPLRECLISSAAPDMPTFEEDDSDQWKAFDGKCYLTSWHVSHWGETINGIDNPRRCSEHHRVGEPWNIIDAGNGKFQVRVVFFLLFRTDNLRKIR